MIKNNGKVGDRVCLCRLDGTLKSPEIFYAGTIIDRDFTRDKYTKEYYLVEWDYPDYYLINPEWESGYYIACYWA